MTGDELLRRLRRIGKERSRRTTLKDRRKEIGTGLLRAMLCQLGLTPRDLE